MSDTELKQLFDNNFDCYTQKAVKKGKYTSIEEEQAMTKDKFVEVVTKLLKANGDNKEHDKALRLPEVVHSTLYDCDDCMNYPCALQEWSSDKGRKLKLNECGDKVVLKKL